MSLDDILKEWEVDSQIDQTELGQESLKTPQLHQKYLKWMSLARLKLKKLEADFKALRMEKYEFYTLGPTQEQKEKGWRLPPKGCVLKAEVNNYLEADPDLVDQLLRIDYQREIIEALDSIIRTINNRGFQIKNAIDWLKFTNGIS